MSDAANPVTVKMSVWFIGVESLHDSALDEVQEVLTDALRSACKPIFEAALAKIGAKDVRIQFIAY